MNILKLFHVAPTSNAIVTQANTESTSGVSLKNKIKYHVSLLFTLANHHVKADTQQWWNHIQGTTIILGAIPLKNRNHHTKIFNEAINKGNQKQVAILTLLEPFEYYSKGLFSNPVTPKDWKLSNVIHKIINASDFNPLSQENIKEAVSFLEEQDKQNISTYVHCKAGRGRSATAVICFLMKKNQLTAEQAKQQVFDSRSQIHLNKRQWKAVKTYESSLKVNN